MIFEGYNIDRCFLFFSQFRIDFPGLEEAGVLQKHIELDHFEWKMKKTSLAEYFIWIGTSMPRVEGGFWAPIENSFLIKGKAIKRGSLTKILAKQTAKQLIKKNGEKLFSPDFEEIKKIVFDYRKTNEKYLEKKKALNDIKTIIEETENDSSCKKVFDVYKKIENIISQK